MNKLVMTNEWQSLQQVFDVLNQNCKYVVLRNYDELEEEKLLKGGDVDILCEDISACVKILQAHPRGRRDTGFNYQILLKTGQIAVDLRMVGDGYYCDTWGKKLLDGRKLGDKGFFVLQEDDYFYSLLYHAIFQKAELKPEYKERLFRLAKQFGMLISKQEDLKKELERYMRENDFFYSNTLDPEVYLNYSNVSKELIKINKIWVLKRYIYGIRCMIGL